VGTAEDEHPPTERMMAVLATFAYVRVLILWSYWLFSKVAKVANIPTGVKVAIFELAAVGEYPRIMSAEPRGRCQVVVARAEAGGGRYGNAERN
jgi:hypothetical protein